MGRNGRIGDIQPFAEIARSPTTVVYKGYQASLDRFVLLKVLTSTYRHDADLVRRFKAEARLLAKVQHPNVVALYAFGEADGQVYLAAEYVDGHSLADVLDGSGPLDEERAVAVLTEMAHGLKAAHDKGVLHRDLKPANILLADAGPVKLADFGMASLDAASDAPSPNAGTHADTDTEVRGTLGYLAPEQILGEPASKATDLFALGATFFEMLTARPAFAGTHASARLDALLHHDPRAALEGLISPSCHAILTRLLAKNPADRYRDADALLADLTRYADASVLAETDGSKAAARPPKSPKSPKRRAGLFAVLFAAAIVALVALGLWRLAIDDARPTPGTTSPAPEAVLHADEPAGLRVDDAPPEDAAFANRSDAQAEPISPEPRPTAPAPAPLSADSAATAGFRPPPVADSTALAARPDAPGSLRVNASPWAIVYIDGDSVGTTPLLGFLLSPGTHRVVLRHPEEPAFPTYRTDLNIAPGEAVDVNVSLWERVGRLALEISPWAEVWLDGIYRDTTPLDSPLILSPGPHTLTLRHPQLGERTMPIRMEAGLLDTLRLNLNMPPGR